MRIKDRMNPRWVYLRFASWSHCDDWSHIVFLLKFPGPWREKSWLKMCRIGLENQRFIEYLLQPHRHPLAHPPLSPPSSDMKGEGDISHFEYFQFLTNLTSILQILVIDTYINTHMIITGDLILGVKERPPLRSHLSLKLRWRGSPLKTSPMVTTIPFSLVIIQRFRLKIELKWHSRAIPSKFSTPPQNGMIAKCSNICVTLLHGFHRR